MKEKGKQRAGLWIILLVLAVAVAAYFLFFRQADDTAPSPQTRPVAEPETTKHLERKAVPTEGRTLPPAEGASGVTGGKIPESGAEAPSVSGEPEAEADPCKEVERDVRDFFRYLDGKDYVMDLTGDSDSWTVFTRVLAKLSARPPVPAGEGLDTAVMTANIYHLFRVLDDRDIHLTREIIRHEADSLEINMDILYRWLTLGDRCPDPEGLRPSAEVLYRYAGFFMNTIGGRAYLFRRPSWVRLLMSYYSVLILHDADQEGRNTSGIDVYPLVRDLGEEMARNPGAPFPEKLPGSAQDRRGILRRAEVVGLERHLQASKKRSSIRTTVSRAAGSIRPPAPSTGSGKINRPILSNGSAFPSPSSHGPAGGPSRRMTRSVPRISSGSEPSPTQLSPRAAPCLA